MTREKSGKIISFYSFKGGVGRSMALANVGALLCRAGKSVLVVDWDLEAPGLHKFFEQSSPELKRRSENTLGVLDLIDGAKAGGTLPWREAVIDVPLGERSLSLIAAGRRDELYGARLQGLQWDRLYKEMDIGQAFEDMRDDWKRSYDYVLLDSRTGVTDIGDVCTALFPDLLVTVFVANEQNIEGTKLIIERARAVHGQLPRDRTKLTVIPLLGRDESYTEYELSQSWRKRISDELGFTLSDWMPKDVDAPTYFQKIFIPYYSYWSFGENLPVVQREEEIGNPASISAAYARLVSLIDSGLDWKVLEAGVNSAEIDSLRSRASVSDATNAELASKKEQVDRLELQYDKLLREAKARKRWVLLIAASVMFAVLSIAGTFLALNELNGRRELLAKAQVEQMESISQLTVAQKIQADQRESISQLTAARKAADENKKQLETEKADFARQLAELQRQNASLLGRLTEASDRLARENFTTQKKLDEIIRQNSGVR